ncbi:Sec-independent protein translocase protein TatB [Erythrobacter sp. THAF29]|uniref:Sec-independent protein translocase protein TatB n=1 Tax=Erythrobacter sp. THAF29 TaxID=2587851 RepID=UPI001267DB4E|nr:Sec-independent protein translocase protein TatB [Erythrobacter sp. THAF29]QFT77033.1 Sec-independent protein translocase protein TatB [Erythrobacter sp. THAF29]
MFDIGAAELLVIVIVAIIVIGPKEMPRAMRTAGRWIGQVRRVSAHFRTGIDAMVREAELEDMEKKWKAQNEEIMRRSAANAEADKGEPVMTGPPPVEGDSGPDPMADDPVPEGPPQPKKADDAAPELPLAPLEKPKE